MAPFIFLTNKIEVSNKPTTNVITAASNLPKPTMVAGLATMNLAFDSPINVMNNPMPEAIAYRNGLGMALTI